MTWAAGERIDVEEDDDDALDEDWDRFLAHEDAIRSKRPQSAAGTRLGGGGGGGRYGSDGEGHRPLSALAGRRPQSAAPSRTVGWGNNTVARPMSAEGGGHLVLMQQQQQQPGADTTGRLVEELISMMPSGGSRPGSAATGRRSRPGSAALSRPGSATTMMVNRVGSSGTSKRGRPGSAQPDVWVGGGWNAGGRDSSPGYERRRPASAALSRPGGGGGGGGGRGGGGAGVTSRGPARWGQNVVGDTGARSRPFSAGPLRGDTSPSKAKSLPTKSRPSSAKAPAPRPWTTMLVPRRPVSELRKPVLLTQSQILRAGKGPPWNPAGLSVPHVDLFPVNKRNIGKGGGGGGEAAKRPRHGRGGVDGDGIGVGGGGKEGGDRSLMAIRPNLFFYGEAPSHESSMPYTLHPTPYTLHP
jgi:hypothetical protein